MSIKSQVRNVDWSDEVQIDSQRIRAHFADATFKYQGASAKEDLAAIRYFVKEVLVFSLAAVDELSTQLCTQLWTQV